MHTALMNNTLSNCPKTITEIHDTIYKVNFGTRNSLKLVYLNARSIKNKQDELAHIINAVKTDIHVITITETWIKKGEEAYFHFNGYISYYAGRQNKAGVGAGILIKNTVRHELIEVFSDEENSLICVKIHNNNESWIITNVYRPPNAEQQKINHFITTIEDHLYRINNTTVNIIVTGDYNFDTIDENDQYVQQHRNTMLSHNLHICNTSIVTREPSQTALDHIFINNFNVLVKLQYVPYNILDHRLIFVELSDALPIMICPKHFTLKKKQILIN